MKFGMLMQIVTYRGHIVKISNFSKTKMAAAAILKNHKKLRYHCIGLADYLRNLARSCKMGLLTIQTVEKFKFPKSKMADGRHFKNR